MTCGRELDADFARFCLACGAALGASPAGARAAQDRHRRVLRVTGSTALGESARSGGAARAARALLRADEGDRRAHGGTVEKFIGDAVMAVFGVPVVHEDDALRASERRSRCATRCPELGLQARIGVNTGEVVTGTAERLATGDAVNVAARLEQAAATGRDADRRGDAAARRATRSRSSEVEPLALKGKSSQSGAPLLSVGGDQASRGGSTRRWSAARRSSRRLRDASGRRCATVRASCSRSWAPPASASRVCCSSSSPRATMP